MVAWENIVSAVSNNPFKSSFLSEIVVKAEPTIQRFPIKEYIREPQPVVSANAVSGSAIPKKRKGRELDPLVIDMADTVELYDSAPATTRKQLECDEAMRIEKMLGDLYKSQSGRSRGWTKVGLEALIQPRCASGGDIKELDKSKKAFAWPLVADDKVYTSFLDFICLAKKIRVAVWFEEEKHVVLFPAADMNTSSEEPPLYNITMNGIPLNREIKTGAALIAACEEKQFILMPPASVFHTLSTLSMAEIESVSKKMGVETTGNKKERVAKLASFKLRNRLQKVEGALT